MELSRRVSAVALTFNNKSGIINGTQKPDKLFHRPIRSFGIEGQFVDDSQIPLIRAQYEALVIHDARTKGYLPVLDLDTSWSTWYDATKNHWHFKLTVYAVYMGKRKALEWEGLSNGKMIPRSSQRIM